MTGSERSEGAVDDGLEPGPDANPSGAPKLRVARRQRRDGAADPRLSPDRANGSPPAPMGFRGPQRIGASRPAAGGGPTRSRLCDRPLDHYQSHRGTCAAGGTTVRQKVSEPGFRWEADAHERPVDIMDSIPEPDRSGLSAAEPSDLSATLRLPVGLAGQRGFQGSPTLPTGPLRGWAKPLVSGACLLAFSVGWSWGSAANSAPEECTSIAPSRRACPSHAEAQRSAHREVLR
jgi:hypothetical protein